MSVQATGNRTPDLEYRIFALNDKINELEKERNDCKEKLGELGK